MKKMMQLAIAVLLSAGMLSAQTWRQSVTASYPAFNAVCMVDSLKGWAAGGSGVVLKTTDGGLKWTPVTTGLTSSLSGIAFATQTTGIITTGRAYLRTTDGGTTWSAQTNFPFRDTTSSVRSIQFISAMDGFVLGAVTGSSSKLGTAQVCKTTNAGVSWDTLKTIVGVLSDDFLAMSFSGAAGVIVGKPYNVLYYTANGGTTWTKGAAGTLGGGIYTRSDMRAVQLVTPKIGYAVGWGSFAAGLQPSIILKTTDGGANWVQQLPSLDNMVYDNMWSVAFFDSANGFIAGGAIRGAIILSTTDGGTNWKKINAELGNEVSAMAVSGKNILFAGSEGVIGQIQKGSAAKVVTPILSATLFTAQ